MRSLITALVLIATFESSASAQQLWQNTRAGMSQTEVARVQPSARPPAGTPATLHDGAICALQIPSIEIGGSNYKACFFFKNNHLEQVMLSSIGEPSEPQFRDVVTLLRTKYGAELSMDRTSLGWSADWKTPDGANISVVYMDQYGNLLNINYQVRLKTDSEKL